MARTVRLRKIGRLIMLPIPKPLLEALDLGPELAVALSIQSGKLVLKPKRRRYSLKDLLAEHKRSRQLLPADHEFVSSKAIRRELI